jgi:hypothetical protein
VQIALVWGGVLTSKERKSVRFDSDIVLAVDQLVPCLDVKNLRCTSHRILSTKSSQARAFVAVSSIDLN